MENTVNNTLQVFTNEELNANIRVVEIDGQPFFVAKDVCESLDIGTTAKALERLDDDEKGATICRTPGGKKQFMPVLQRAASSDNSPLSAVRL